MEKEATAIIPNLYIGDKEELKKVNDVHLLINCTVDIPFPKYSPYSILLRIPIEEERKDNIKFLEMIIYTKVIEKIYKCICNRQTVFIYGYDQRSFSLIGCFLQKYLILKPNQAIQFVYKKMKCEYENENIFNNTLVYYYHYLQSQKIDEKKQK